MSNERIRAKLNPEKFSFNFPSTITKVERVPDSVISNINARLSSKTKQNNMELSASSQEAGKFHVR